jgi:hypothetical protein
MGRIGTCCSHPQRQETDRALVEGRGNRRIAARYGLSENAIRRHRAEHIHELLLKAYEAQQVAEAGYLLADIARIRESAFDLLDRAERAHDWRARVAVIKQCHENVRILGELQGRLEASRQKVSINLVASAEWIELRGLIVSVLWPHPEALEDVRAAIEQGESNGYG